MVDTHNTISISRVVIGGIFAIVPALPEILILPNINVDIVLWEA